MISGLSDTAAILIVVALIAIFIALWMFSSRQKRKYDEAQRARKREIAALKAKAAKKNTPS